MKFSLKMEHIEEPNDFLMIVIFEMKFRFQQEPRVLTQSDKLRV